MVENANDTQNTVRGLHIKQIHSDLKNVKIPRIDEFPDAIKNGQVALFDFTPEDQARFPVAKMLQGSPASVKSLEQTLDQLEKEKTALGVGDRTLLQLVQKDLVGPPMTGALSSEDLALKRDQLPRLHVTASRIENVKVSPDNAAPAVVVADKKPAAGESAPAASGLKRENPAAKVADAKPASSSPAPVSDADSSPVQPVEITARRVEVPSEGTVISDKFASEQAGTQSSGATTYATEMPGVVESAPLPEAPSTDSQATYAYGLQKPGEYVTNDTVLKYQQLVNEYRNLAPTEIGGNINLGSYGPKANGEDSILGPKTAASIPAMEKMVGIENPKGELTAELMEGLEKRVAELRADGPNSAMLASVSSELTEVVVDVQRKPEQADSKFFQDIGNPKEIFGLQGTQSGIQGLMQSLYPNATLPGVQPGSMVVDNGPNANVPGSLGLKDAPPANTDQYKFGA